MSTPTQRIGLTAAEWKARYAEIAPLYVGGNMQIAKPINWERVRQWEQLTYALERPRNVKIPEDPAFAFKAIYSHVAGVEK